MAIRAGTVGDFGGSMAEAIEKALNAEWKNVKGYDMPEPGQEDRRILFVAIAQGVIRYLKDNAGSLSLADLKVSQTNDSRIRSTGTLAAPPGTVQVIQDAEQTNKVKSKVSGGAIGIETEGTLL